MLVGKSQTLELHRADAGYAFFAKRYILFFFTSNLGAFYLHDKSSDGVVLLV